MPNPTEAHMPDNLLAKHAGLSVFPAFSSSHLKKIRYGECTKKTLWKTLKKKNVRKTYKKTNVMRTLKKKNVMENVKKNVMENI